MKRWTASTTLACAWGLLGVLVPPALRAAPPPNAPAAAVDDTPPLPPPHKRPLVVLDTFDDAGLLTPSAQEVAKAVVGAMMKRYGSDSVVLEDEAKSLRKLRRMSRGMGALMPADADRTQRGRLALLDWSLKEAPVRVKITFKRDKKGKGYVATAACRRVGTVDVLHQVEGRGARYDDAVNDLTPHLKTFCGVLDGVLVERQKARTGATP